MRRRGNLNIPVEDQNSTSGPRRLSQVIDELPSRTRSYNDNPQHLIIPTSLHTTSERWSSERRYSTPPTDGPTSIFSNVDDDDDLHSTLTILGWNSQGDEQLLSSSLSSSSSRLSQGSYSPTLEDTEALEEAWTEYTLSQSQLTDSGSSSHIQDDQDSSSSSTNTSTIAISPNPLLAQSLANAGDEDGESGVSQRQYSPGSSRIASMPFALKYRLQLAWRTLNVFIPSIII